MYTQKFVLKCEPVFNDKPVYIDSYKPSPSWSEDPFEFTDIINYCGTIVEKVTCNDFSTYSKLRVQYHYKDLCFGEIKISQPENAIIWFEPTEINSVHNVFFSIADQEKKAIPYFGTTIHSKEPETVYKPWKTNTTIDHYLPSVRNSQFHQPLTVKEGDEEKMLLIFTGSYDGDVTNYIINQESHKNEYAVYNDLADVLTCLTVPSNNLDGYASGYMEPDYGMLSNSWCKFRIKERILSFRNLFSTIIAK